MVTARPVAGLVAASLAVAPAWAAAPAPGSPGGDEDPRAVEARAACGSGQVERGVQLLSEYLASTKDTTALYNMGRCYQQNGLTDRALASFREYLRKAPDLTAADRREVDAHIAELEAHQQPLPQPEVPSAGGETTGRPGLRTAGIVAGGAGVVALGAAVIFGLQVSSANDDLRKEQPWTSWERRRSEGVKAETLQWVFLGLGGAALAAGGVCYLLALPRPGEGRTALVPWLHGAGGGLALAGTY
jgi:hypothetical protein